MWYKCLELRSSIYIFKLRVYPRNPKKKRKIRWRGRSWSDLGLCPWDWSTRYCTNPRERPSLLDLLSEFGLISDGWLGSINRVYISFGDWANALECWRSPSLRLVITGIAVSPGVTHSDSRIVFNQGWAQDLLGRDRDRDRDLSSRDRDETETFAKLSETRPRRDPRVSEKRPRRDLFLVETISRLMAYICMVYALHTVSQKKNPLD